MRRAYKIVEQVDDEIRTLFHGIDGSRVMPRGVWINATEKMVKDGTSKTTYLSGWHVLLSKKDAYEYLERFTRRLNILKVVECWVDGIRPKEHSLSPVMLAKRIKF